MGLKQQVVVRCRCSPCVSAIKWGSLSSSTTTTLFTIGQHFERISVNPIRANSITEDEPLCSSLSPLCLCECFPAKSSDSFDQGKPIDRSVSTSSTRTTKPASSGSFRRHRWLKPISMVGLTNRLLLPERSVFRELCNMTRSRTTGSEAAVGPASSPHVNQQIMPFHRLPPSRQCLGT
jgi:hypothetical protein